MDDKTKRVIEVSVRLSSLVADYEDSVAALQRTPEYRRWADLHPQVELASAELRKLAGVPAEGVTRDLLAAPPQKALPGRVAHSTKVELTARILEVLRCSRRTMNAAQVSRELGEGDEVKVRVLLCRLVKQKRAARRAPGMFEIASTKQIAARAHR